MGRPTRGYVAAVNLTDDCVEPGFRAIKFPDPDGYEVDVYWEAAWPPS